jgi:hypothetical protein
VADSELKRGIDSDGRFRAKAGVAADLVVTPVLTRLADSELKRGIGGAG